MLLLALSLVLAYLTTAIRRFHEKTTAAVKDSDDQRSRRIKVLSEVYGKAYELIRQFDGGTDRPTCAALGHWAECLQKTLWICYGSDGETNFSRGGYYTVTVPEAESITQTGWGRTIKDWTT
jgi:hypothetical protein